VEELPHLFSMSRIYLFGSLTGGHFTAFRI